MHQIIKLSSLILVFIGFFTTSLFAKDTLQSTTWKGFLYNQHNRNVAQIIIHFSKTLGSTSGSYYQIFELTPRQKDLSATKEFIKTKVLGLPENENKYTKVLEPLTDKLRLSWDMEGDNKVRIRFYDVDYKYLVFKGEPILTIVVDVPHISKNRIYDPEMESRSWNESNFLLGGGKLQELGADGFSLTMEN